VAGLNFPVINYYDGQGFLVPKSLGASSALALSGATVCVQIGTTNELNLADFFRANKMELRTVTLDKYEEMIGAYLAGRCDALSADASALATIRMNATPQPDQHVWRRSWIRASLSPARARSRCQNGCRWKRRHPEACR
jgi:general L-amino acid transport system substrate-binding protein